MEEKMTDKNNNTSQMAGVVYLNSFEII